jgi:hypothetical protein
MSQFIGFTLPLKIVDDESEVRRRDDELVEVPHGGVFIL